MPSNDELDIYNVLEDAFLRYVGGSDSLFGEDIHNLFQRVAERIEAHTQAEVERAKQELINDLYNLEADSIRYKTIFSYPLNNHGKRLKKYLEKGE